MDVLRASTTISFALANGAGEVIPCGSIDDAVKLKSRFKPGDCLLGGERGGVRIDGFDLSNSPDDYDCNTIGGKTIGFTTTNGTSALLRAKQAESILIGSFVNLSAIVSKLSDAATPVHIVCAGTNGAITGEDVLFAGALSSRLCETTPNAVVSDSTILAMNHWQQECGRLSNSLIEASLRRSQGGRNLIALGYDKDIATAASLDTVRSAGIVAEGGSIRLMNQ